MFEKPETAILMCGLEQMKNQDIFVKMKTKLSLMKSTYSNLKFLPPVNKTITAVYLNINLGLERSFYSNLYWYETKQHTSLKRS